MLVQAPVSISMSRPVAFRIVSSRLPSHALMRIFSTMKSPGRGSSPATGAAPQEPRTIALESTRPSNSGAFSVTPGAPGSTTNQTWITTTPPARGVGEPANIVDDMLRAGMRRRAGIREGATLHDDVVLQVLDQQRTASWVELKAL